ncbi:MAG: rhodanese-like domain-containing protein [Archangium sp.]|nr:rhodanese-like domain-containing protein [Archangium sp.]
MKRFALLAFLSLSLAVTACAGEAFTPSAEAKALVKAGAVLVDVRTPEEFAAKHLDGAVNIPIDDLEARKAELPKDKDIVLYCRSGARSARGKSLLASAGYTRVHNLGPMSNW